MGRCKDIIVKPIKASVPNAFVCRYHYSGKVVPNSQLHLGCYLDDVLGGVMQFGPSLFKKGMLGIVRGTTWNGFIELNRMAFSDILPRNSESRCISVALRMIRKNYPHIKWVVSFADGCQCGDGTIYRASGFLLTGITVAEGSGTNFYRLPNGESYTNITCKMHGYAGAITHVCDRETFDRFIGTNVSSSARMDALIKHLGGVKLRGYSLRYIYFTDPEWRDRLAVPVLPYDAIDKAGARMYLGQHYERDVDKQGKDVE